MRLKLIVEQWPDDRKFDSRLTFQHPVAADLQKGELLLFFHVLFDIFYSLVTNWGNSSRVKENKAE